VICSDKTGTLTRNQMTVCEVHAGGQSFTVTGDGYLPVGALLMDGRNIRASEHPALSETLFAGVLCNDTLLVEDEHGAPKVQGDPTEAALLVAGHKAGFVHAETRSTRPRLDVIPFESEHMFMATLHEAEPRVIYKKGAPLRILSRCDRALGADGTEGPIDIDAIRTAAHRMAARGLRVLAFARRHVASDHGGLTHAHVSAGLTFLGLQGMIDPARAEVAGAVGECLRAGISVKMITGDHAVTAAAIARQLGLRGAVAPDGSLRAITGGELARLPAESLPQVAEETAVFARVAPEQKLRLVEALQSRGHVVAMTGDGVNDAPALKQADIGVAMGITGTDVAKGAAAMVLTDDNFATIKAAVEEGRNVFDNLVKFIVWTLPTNGGEGLLLLTAIVLGAPLPVLPVHVLWINLTTAIFLGLMLVFEPKEPGIMDRPPRDPAQPLLSRPLILRTLLVSLLMLLGGYGLFVYEQRRHGATVEEARTIVTNLIIVAESFYLLNCRSLTHTFLRLGWFSNPWIWRGIAVMIGLQLSFNYLPLMNRLFQSAPVRPESWLHVALLGLGAFVLIEFEKWLRFGGRRGRPVVPA